MDKVENAIPEMEDYRRLYQAAEDFKQLACWKWMSDIDIFGVQDPVSGEIGYCSVMGASGKLVGLAVYVGDEGFTYLQSLLEECGIEPTDPDFELMQRCLLVVFENREELTKRDLEIIKMLGLKFRGRKQWPLFRSLLPGYHPWYLNQAEARFLTICLEQAQEVARACRENRNYLPLRGFVYLVRVPESGEEGLRWSDKHIYPCPAPAPKPRLAVKQKLVQAIKESCRVSDQVWEVDASFAPVTIQEDRNSRPYYPRLFLCGDTKSGLIIGYDMFKPNDLPKEIQERFLQVVAETKTIPQLVATQNAATRTALQPLAKKLGVTLLKVRALPIIDALREEMARRSGV
ncbi:MAG: hypothetical protein PWQ13_560 [Bacillota bacterium]|nr:hypothetical protein [Bacillota bacterium]